MPFTHLEVHSHYTLLGATPGVDALVARASEEGMEHLALTDSDALYGAVAFTRACRRRDLRPIIGMTLAVHMPTDLSPRVPDPAPGHVALLAANQEGYRSLSRLASLVQGNPDRDPMAPAGVPWATLAEHREGLVCMSGGGDGWLYRLLRQGDTSAAQLLAGKLAMLFDERAVLSLQLDAPDDTAVAAQVVALGRRLGLPVVAAQPVYCLDRSEIPLLVLLEAIRSNRPLAELGDAPATPGRTGYWLTRDEMEARFSAFPGVVAMTGEVAGWCGDTLPGGRTIWPSLDLPAGSTPESKLRSKAYAGVSSRFGDDAFGRDEALRARLDHELDVIGSQGFAPLFLVVADIVRFARSHGVPVSTRGSVANSLVAFCIGITTVDPIEHELLFERFLSPARADAPDIDLDFCSVRRDEVLAYVRDTYGADRVALIGTVSTLRAQSAVREVAKAYGVSEADTNRIVALLPRHYHPDPRRRDRRTLDDVLEKIPEAGLREVVRLGYSLVGQPDHLSVHPGGVVITPGPLWDTVPVQWAPKGFLITQFDHGDVEELGLPKIDLLGVRALTVLRDAVDRVRSERDPSFRVDDIPLDDEATAERLSQGDTVGVFQCESFGARRTLRKLKARTIADLAIANAFFKPGPAMGGMADTFVRRYRGEEPVEFLHPALKPILRHTMGVLIFQEQILRVVTEIAGLSWAQADHIRRGMSKFRGGEMEALREQFVSGCRHLQSADGPLDAVQAETLWGQVEAFAGYGFNQGHATAYADVSFRSAYLKTHYPAEFLAARLANQGGFHDPAVYMAEARRMGIDVRQPHVNHSEAAFSLSYADGPQRNQPVLWMGLGQVRDLRQTTVEEIIRRRQECSFDSVRDLMARANLQAREIEHLIQCGALDGLGASRTSMLKEAESIRRSGSAFQLAFGFSEPPPGDDSPKEIFAWERHVLGIPMTVSPLDLVSDQLPEHVSIAELRRSQGRAQLVAGYRLPGWTGTEGFFLSDGTDYVVVRGARGMSIPSPLAPLVVNGRWMQDGFGVTWLHAMTVRTLGAPSAQARPRRNDDVPRQE